MRMCVCVCERGGVGVVCTIGARDAPTNVVAHAIDKGARASSGYIKISTGLLCA